jgi:hypothetical protein
VCGERQVGRSRNGTTSTITKIPDRLVVKELRMEMEDRGFGQVDYFSSAR